MCCEFDAVRLIGTTQPGLGRAVDVLPPKAVDEWDILDRVLPDLNLKFLGKLKEAWKALERHSDNGRGVSW